MCGGSRCDESGQVQNSPIENSRGSYYAGFGNPGTIQMPVFCDANILSDRKRVISQEANIDCTVKRQRFEIFEMQS